MATGPKVSSVDLAENINENNDGKTVMPEVSDERREEVIQEIKKIEDDIVMLKNSIQRKEKKLNELRNEIGDTRWARIQNSQAVNKSKQVLSDATQKTSSALKTLGTATVNKWTEIKESPKVASVSERFWTTTNVVKAKLTGETNETSKQVVQTTTDESHA
ncbi:uncharacterized protein LOC100207039 isoform X3 [Hydra vulgaris]|uniref:Uncharacterized protein LOC100207039 isoform X3 n=1 Tax=Hydra vulgaris TaxID=6087 RepID=A0ABM4BTI7_HYDVU